MNRRYFLELLAKAGAVSTVAYSFPSVIKPQNISTPELVYYSNQHVVGEWVVYKRPLSIASARIIFPVIPNSTNNGNP